MTLKTKICREFYFDAVKGTDKNLNGHTYKLEITLEDEIKDNGMVLDFVDLKRIIKVKVLDKLDHQNLNGIIENPTGENVAEWIKEQLKGEIPVKSIKLWVGEGKWVELD